MITEKELINNALEDIQDYYNKVGLGSEIQLVKYIESKKEKGLYLIIFESDMCISCAVAYDYGGVYVLSEKEQTQPQTPDDKEQYYWIDTTTKQEIVFVEGVLIPVFNN